MKEKTAMQNLKDYLSNTYGLTTEDMYLKIEQLIDIEKQQIVEAFIDGHRNGNEPHRKVRANDYYKETYES